VHVRIEQSRYMSLKAKWLDLAVHRRSEWFERRFGKLPFEPYAPLRGQLFGLLRKINERRALAQFEPVPRDCIRVRRRIVSPFERSAESLDSQLRNTEQKPIGPTFAAGASLPSPLLRR